MKHIALSLFLSLLSYFNPEKPTESATMLGHNYSWVNGESDYWIHVNFNELDNERCDCSQVRSATWWIGTWRSGSWAFTYTNLGTSGDFYIYPGPGYNQTLFLTTHYDGTEKRDGCLHCGTSLCEPKDCNKYTDANNSTQVWTSSIYPPTSVSATDGDFDTKVVITWEKGTHTPDANHSYRIYRNNVLIGTAPGSARSYEDTMLQPGQTYTYSVRTYTTVNSTQESSAVSDQGSTFDVGLVASDGDFYSRTKLSWNDLSKVADDIRIERSVPGTTNREEIAIVNKNSTAYNDQDGVPGYQYTYYVTPITEAAAFLTDEDTGYSRPNGKITGHVKSKLNAGVSGVEVNVELISTIPPGGYALPANCAETYCATTDAEGYYEIKDIYYYDGAEFRVVPYKSGSVPHQFSPDTIIRTLDVNTKTASGVDFTDLTVFTVGGKVTYPDLTGTECGIKGVSILINGQDYGVMTDNNGDWSFAIQEEALYTFQPRYLHHAFENINGESRTSLLIAADVTNIHFTDVETDDLRITVQAGCKAPLGDKVEVVISAPNSCYEKTLYTDANGILIVEDLPARDYSVQVTDIIDPGNPNISNILDQIGFRPVEIDLTIRDTAEIVTETDTTIITPMTMDTLPNGEIVTTPADTVMTTLRDTTYGDVAPAVTFIYRSPLEISTDWEAAGATVTDCHNSAGDNIILMEQGLSYIVQFDVKEVLGVDCYIDTGFLKIYDFVSDRGGTAIKVPIVGGVATYVIDAGEPIVASNPTFHDHEKLLYIIPEVDLLEPEPIEYWIMVTGAKSNTPSFITRTPEIPMIILHDPPGDGSYSFIEKGTSYTSFTTNEVLVGGEAGVYLNLLLGAKVLTPFSGNGFGTQIKFEASAGRDNFDRDGIYTTITFNERFSTSDIENLTGYDGDVYIGAAFNQEFSLAQLLTFDKDNCESKVDIVPSIAVEDFATTFVYTEKHIRNTLLPTISFIKNNILDNQPFSSLSLEDQAQVNNLIADSISWTNILRQNEIARDSSALFLENISFSAGAELSREYTTDTMTTHSYEYNRFVNLSFGLGAKIDNESGIWFDSELGVMGKFRWSTTVNEGNDTTLTRTVGYVLKDNDIGDFFSVDVKQDVSHNVPAFKLKLGTTSCPQEPGSQARDRATIQVFPPELTNIPDGEAANFLCQITNVSESFETREYGVRIVPTTNPDGMIATLAGQWVGSGEGTFWLEPNQTKNMVLSFDKGPLASTYQDVAIMIYPVCEYPLWQDNGNLTNSDTAWIRRIEWQTVCTDVALHNPDDGWLVNQQSNNKLRVTFSGYDVNNPLFQSLTLQIKKEGGGYVDQVTIQKENLIGSYYDVYLDVSGFPDGNYRLRARANCGIEGGITYSSEKAGIIDRTSIAPFGIPTPSDGFLREGQEVSVSFDKQIDCNISSYPHEISLVRADTDEPIPFTTSCLGNKLIINTNPPLLDQTDLEGVLVKARVHQLQDLNGNAQEYPTEWAFLVNVSPVFWDPEHLTASGYEGQSHVIHGTLKNTSLLSKVFSLDIADNPDLISYPDWLTPVQTRGAILSENQYEVGFYVDEGLSPGIYTGVVTAMVDSLPVSMDVTFELLAKPVNWPFNPDGYQYSMTVIAQFSLDGGDTNLSTDTRDQIGAFVNGQIRGVTNMVYIPELNVYRAFLTVYSNVQGGGSAETVSFRFWRALTGVEYGAEETIPFTLDATTGSVASPKILHPQGFIQVIPLNAGWNWISLNVLNNNMSKEQIFQSIINSPAANTVTIKSKSQTTTHSPQSGWSGSLSNLQLGNGYLVHLSNNSDTLRVAGLPSANIIAVNVLGNWNWIGYPRLNPEPVNDVLSDLTNAVNGNILKSQTHFSAYNQSTSSWIGNLNFFNPGEGYKLFLTNPGVIFFDPSRDARYSTNPYLYEYNMNINAHADLRLIGSPEEEDMLVAAFIDGQCRGTGRFEYNEMLREWRIVLLVNGNADDIDKPIEFRMVDESTGDEYITNGYPLTFVADGIVATIEEPYDFFHFSTATEETSIGGYILEQSTPNPTKGRVEIGFQIPESTEVNITILDLNGKVLLQENRGVLNAGRHTVNMNLTDFPKGVYYYELRTQNFNGVKKLVKQ